MTYRTTVSDPLLRLLSFVVVAFIGMVVVFSLIGLCSIWVVAIAYIAVVVSLSFLLMQLFSVAMVETELLSDRLRLKWIKQNIFDKQDDREILFKDVDEDGFMTSRVVKEYTLFFKSGREFSYKQFNWFTPAHEDLELMGRDIREAIEHYHIQNPEPWVPAGYEKKTAIPLTEEEKRQASVRLYVSVFAIIAIYAFLGFPILKMMFPDASFKWDLKVLGIVASIVFLVSKVYGSIHERRQKANDVPTESD
jgi:hypothetical protein